MEAPSPALADEDARLAHLSHCLTGVLSSRSAPSAVDQQPECRSVFSCSQSSRGLLPCMPPGCQPPPPPAHLLPPASHQPTQRQMEALGGQGARSSLSLGLRQSAVFAE